ncbi:class IIb bacteriocin, lactobin A/cerein 7B family [Neisseria sp.]|uniref:class IIb bacteriocin, lactobin A/cerein 7B family n=1 Tax=Neisseria sp. TaxID=192066 RepID=UPI0026DCE06A|nr:class IIb bacteriocin, lactobin A/cerein 7B family [Neisseria sp.]MDO4906693.1 class IIb bacteriocin, lactobin A/cerein 7B family [Neisseria sp.]
MQMKHVQTLGNVRELEMHELESISGGFPPALIAAGYVAAGFGTGFGVSYGLARWLG